MDKIRITFLYHKYLNKTATPKEAEEFKAILNNKEFDGVINELVEGNWNKITDEELESVNVPHYEEILKEIKLHPQKRAVKSKLWPRVAAAATILLVAATSLYFYRHNAVEKINQTTVSATDIAPGKTKATLTLANGKTISLPDAANGELLKQSGIAITKTADGQLVYQASPGKIKDRSEAVNYNTISTPKGGQYQVLLSDGSKVWLNAASSLKFPAVFNGSERNVELSGEAYFEVEKNEKMPFNVIANGTKVAVLGTHFNIMAYADGGAVKTTLLEGSVKLSKGRLTALLKPGQQGLVSASSGTFEIEEADVESAVAWKNGYFMFNDSNFQEVMRQIARWYDVDLVYKNKTNSHEFVGKISRKYNLSKVLKILEISEVRFELKERTLIVN